VALSAKHYRWTWHFRSPPAALWPLVSNTDRFNRDCGLPPFEVRKHAEGEPAPELGVRRLRSVYLGIVGEWEEREFEWVQPLRFAVQRSFTQGPLASMVQSCELAPNDRGGTRLAYEMRIVPRNLLGAAIVPIAVGVRMRRAAGRVLMRYDEAAQRGSAIPDQGRPPSMAALTRRRLAPIASRLATEERQPGSLVERLCGFISSADDLSASKIRPYALADAWGASRRETLDLFLNATRAGMLDLSWEVLCPHCRGSRHGGPSLESVRSQAHCDSCGIDFTINFDQSVELTFSPNPNVRQVARLQYCVGGPQVTPHVVAQKRLGPGECLFIAMSYPQGRYRIRTQGSDIQHAFRVERDGQASVTIRIEPGPAPSTEPAIAPDGVLTIQTADGAGRMVVIERVAWTDQSVSAAAVTSRQTFRDLFSREILRQGERISVGAMTIVFTDLKNSTRLYREIGDAPAFGRVLDHFAMLKAAVSEGGGAVIKTMGDAVMATFTEPVAALRAMRRAQARLARADGGLEPLALKCSIHRGPCLAISQNEHLDYFGTTVNVCSRLCSLSTGADIVVTGQVLADADVAATFVDPALGLAATRDASPLRGMGDAPFEFWRVAGPAF
jgi:class 3 adenylate cyclase